MAEKLGDYDLESLVGRGAMGSVFRARHRPTGAIRAVKVVAIVPDPELIARFRREAEALARVGGEGIVPVHEIGAERGRLYLVMSFMPGGSLRSRLAAGVLPWRDAVPIAIDLCRALERCHAAGLVHRDLKPDNVLFDEQGRARLADFGLVRDLGSASLTRTGSLLGTPAYMSPEQHRGQPVDASADIYALGCVLHELVAGRVPFLGPDLAETVALKTRGKRPPLEPGAPPALGAILDRALAPLPAKRYAHAAELCADLEKLLLGKSLEPARSSLPWLAVALIAVVTAASLVAAFELSHEPAPVATPLPVASPAPSPVRRAPSPSPGLKPAEAAKEIRRAATLLTGRAPVERARPIIDRVLETTPVEQLPREVLEEIFRECSRRTEKPPGQLDPKVLEPIYADAFDAIHLAHRLGFEVEPSFLFASGARDWARHFRDGRDDEWTLTAVEAFLLGAQKVEVHYAKDAAHGASVLRRLHPELAPQLRVLFADSEALLDKHDPGSSIGFRVEFLASDERWDEALRAAIAVLKQRPTNEVAKGIAYGVARAGWPPVGPCDGKQLDELFAVVPGSPEFLLLRLQRGVEDERLVADLTGAAADEHEELPQRSAIFVQLATELERHGLDAECAASYDRRPRAVRELVHALADDARRHARVLLRLARGKEAAQVLEEAGGLARLADRARAAATPEECRVLAEELR